MTYQNSMQLRGVVELPDSCHLVDFDGLEISCQGHHCEQLFLIHI